MSNGDDVLDDWEDWEALDEAGLTNTLQKIHAERKTNLNNIVTTTPTTSTIVKSAANLNELTSFPATIAGIDNPKMKLLQRNPSQDNPSGNTSSSAAATVAATVLKSPLDNMAASFQPVMMVLHKSADEYQSANYTQPINSQTVKILRRPTQASEQRNNDMRPRQPIKTLEQREQEYAQARLRIMGSAKNPDDDANATKAISSSAPETPMARTTPATPSTIPRINNVSPKSQSVHNAYNNHYQHQQQQQLLIKHQQQQLQQNYYYQQQQQQPQLTPIYNNRTLPMPLQPQPSPLQHQHQTWSPIVGGSVSTSSPALRQQNDTVLRLPRGPDGSTGFQMRR